MKIHDEEMHIRDGSYFCSENCNATFENKRRIVNHYMLKHKPELLPIKCLKCDKKFLDRHHRRFHMNKEHVPDNLLRCKICEKKLGTPFSLNLHMASMHSEREKYQCHVCAKEFVLQQSFKHHMLCHTITESKFVCKECDKKFLTRRKLNRHVQECHKPIESMKPCTECEFIAKSNTSLRTHMSKHSSERPYSCEVCGQQFKTRRNLNDHSIIHTKYEKKHVCKSLVNILQRFGGPPPLAKNQPVGRN